MGTFPLLGLITRASRGLRGAENNYCTHVEEEREGEWRRGREKVKIRKTGREQERRERDRA